MPAARWLRALLDAWPVPGAGWEPGPAKGQARRSIGSPLRSDGGCVQGRHQLATHAAPGSDSFSRWPRGRPRRASPGSSAVSGLSGQCRVGLTGELAADTDHCLWYPPRHRAHPLHLRGWARGCAAPARQGRARTVRRPDDGTAVHLPTRPEAIRLPSGILRKQERRGGTMRAGLSGERVTGDPRTVSPASSMTGRWCRWTRAPARPSPPSPARTG